MHITKHAYKRAKERCGLKRKSLDRILTIAIERGLTQEDCKGFLLKWVNHVYVSYENGSNMRIYGEHLFICDHWQLITIYLVPNHLKKASNRQLHKKNLAISEK